MNVSKRTDQQDLSEDRTKLTQNELDHISPPQKFP